MYYNNIDNSNKKFVNIMEIMYGIDEVVIDDNFFQISDYFARVKKFLNLKSTRFIKDVRANYRDKKTMNDPIMLFVFGI